MSLAKLSYIYIYIYIYRPIRSVFTRKGLARPHKLYPLTQLVSNYARRVVSSSTWQVERLSILVRAARCRLKTLCRILQARNHTLRRVMIDQVVRWLRGVEGTIISISLSFSSLKHFCFVMTIHILRINNASAFIDSIIIRAFFFFHLL